MEGNVIDPGLGSLIGGIALSLSAIAAITTLFFVSRRQVMLTRMQQDADWQKNFRDTYIQFWKDADLATVRGWISNDNLYEEIEPVLVTRLQSTRNTLSQEDNEKLEMIDRFCAVIASIDVLGAYSLSPMQNTLYQRVYGTFWPDAIQERKALKEYVERYWFDHPIIRPLPEERTAR